MIKRLGEGAFGFVVAAKDKQTGKRIAIKKIKDAFNDEQDGVRYFFSFPESLHSENILWLCISSMVEKQICQ